MDFRKTQTFTGGNEIVLFIIPNGRKAEMGDRTGMSMAGQGYCLSGVCLSGEWYQRHLSIFPSAVNRLAVQHLPRLDQRDDGRLTGRHAGT